MEVIPALDLLDGRAVRLVHGRRDAVTDFGDPVALAEAFVAAGARRLHLVDLSGAFDGKPVHTEIIRRIARLVPVQVGGGLRTAEDLVRTFDLGVERAVVGTAAVESPELLDAVDPERLVVGVDVKEGRVATRGWVQLADVAPGPFVDAMAARGVRRILCTAVHRDGTLEGPDLDVLREVSGRGVAVIASGGVSSLADLRALTAAPDVEAVVVGKALLTGRFTLPAAVEAAC
jgi:phosphoribosylformimino-5-aminoimidazole carboxamide ribotide isomerase